MTTAEPSILSRGRGDCQYRLGILSARSLQFGVAVAASLPHRYVIRPRVDVDLSVVAAGAELVRQISQFATVAADMRISQVRISGAKGTVAEPMCSLPVIP
jgi:hypothetical protein